MAAAIERRMTLRDQVTPTMNNINRSTMAYERNLRSLRNTGQNSFNSLKSGLLGMAATAFAVVKSVAAINEMEEAYKKQMTAEVKLQAVFDATGKATKAQVDELKKYASILQGTGIIGDEVTLGGMQQLATFNVTNDTVKKLSQGMVDLLAQQKGYNATQEDAVTIGNMIGKTMDGSVGALKKVGISFTEAQEKIIKHGNEQQKAAALAEVLQKNVGGVNAALANTDAGKIIQANNALGDMKEVLGGAVTRIKGEFAKAFMDNLPVIEAQVNAVKNAIISWVDSGGIQNIIDYMRTAGGVVRDLAPLFGGLTMVLIAYKTAAVYAWIAQGGLNAALRANPIGAVVMGVVALVAVITWMRKNWELVQITFMNGWNGIASYTETGVNGLISGANTILSGFSYAAQSIGYFFSQMWNGVVSQAESAVGALLTPVNAIRGALGQETIKADFSGVKTSMERPTFEKQNIIPEVKIKRFSEDAISKLDETRKAKAEAQKSNTLANALLANANAVNANTDATDSNTGALGKKSSDLTGEEIADKLLPRLERFVYG
ncbi:hypothetical protein [Desulfosporosinus nitroreducens]|uniref:hypothetical protein n=1 Tax=Desulfosporosinus nitroreducens TaxID=2018668 RepID=UPI00207C1546|nr:hypothetical protein [Desulfosporosinus nitroreducens]MCO1599823.1 hypothetical protein [Desulfosporosinus nitroreducens]